LKLLSSKSTLVVSIPKESVVHPRRLVRLNELIQQTISRASLSLKDPGLGFVTITGCETSADVSLARVYYSVLGDPKQREETAAALERAKPHLRSEIAKLENIRRVPQLLFLYDDGVERADRVNRILHNIEEERNTSGPSKNN
jgi:ribosome-binding factor A